MRDQDVDVFSILAGVVFVGLGTWFGAEALGWGRVDLAVLWPILLVSAGLAVLVAAFTRLAAMRRR